MRYVTLTVAIASCLLGAAAMAQSTNHADESFLKDFAKANAAEVEEGKLAQDKAQNSDVKAFAKHMVDDHEKALTKVTEVAGKTNVSVKEEPGLTDKGQDKILEHRGADKFDAAYIKAQVKDHQDVLKMLQKEVNEGQNPDVKQLASQSQTVVQHHLDMAKQLQAKVGGTTTNKSSMRERDTTEKSASAK